MLYYADSGLLLSYPTVVEISRYQSVNLTKTILSINDALRQGAHYGGERRDMRAAKAFYTAKEFFADS